MFRFPMAVKFVVTLKSGGDFKPYDAMSLMRQVRKHMKIPHHFVCVTDMMNGFEQLDNSFHLIKLGHGFPGWWSMVEMFRIKGPVIASGLDMIVLDCIDQLAELALTCPKDEFYMARPQTKAAKRGEAWCSGLQIWNGDWTWLYHKFLKRPQFYMEEFVKEQRFTYWHLMNEGVKIRAVQDHFDGYYSYKNHCKNGKPKDARVVLFHGYPRPQEVKAKWVKEIYYNQYEYTHPYEEIKDEANQADRVY